VLGRSTGSSCDGPHVRRLVLAFALVCTLWAAPGALAAGWCGTGGSPVDRPDITTGPQVHAIWAVPSDGGDTFAAGAPKLADDLASIASWWQAQDLTRVPRVDQAAFGGASCADISYVRLPDPGSAFVGADGAFRRVTSDLAAAGFDHPWKKYVVYFDGPSVQQNICGTGAGEFDFGPAYAITWLAGCPGVPTDSIGAHELLHAFGALPPGAPNACPDGSGHPCDSKQDVLYPTNYGSPLASLFLDVNHDDYYGHSGTWQDMQDSVFLNWLNVPVDPLVVLIRGGTGTVSSDLPGLVCTADCTTQWSAASPPVALSAEAGPGSRFVGWRGTACGADDLCAVKMTAPQTVTALFGPKTVPVRLAVTGRGRIACTPRCAKSVAGGSRLGLRAVPATGWRFVRWSGSCKGTAPLCRPSTATAVTARATFRKR
jgi:hypothetical protein